MANLDAEFVKFTGKAVAHSDTSATTILTIVAKANHQYQLLIIAKSQHDSALSDRVGFIAELEISTTGSLFSRILNVIATNDPNTTGYTISVSNSGFNVAIEITGNSATVSSAVAIGTEFEQTIGE